MEETKHPLLSVEAVPDDEELSLRAILNSGVACDVEITRRGREALLYLLDAELRVPRLVVLSFDLPEFNSFEILRQIRQNERFNSVPIVLLNAFGSNAGMCQCLDEGAASCVQKPIDVLEYLDKVGFVIKYWLSVDQRSEPSLLRAKPSPRQV